MTAQTISTKTKKPKKKPDAKAGLNTVGARIITARRTYDITQVQLAERLKVTRAAVSQYEQDKNRPRPEIIDRLADVFHADPEWFDRGRGQGPKRSDVPVTIAEVELGGLTTYVTDLRNLRNGYDWRARMGAFELPVSPEHMIVFRVEKHASPYRPGDWVFVDTEQRSGPADSVFLVQAPDLTPHLSHGKQPGEGHVLGRVMGYFRPAAA